MLCPIFSGSSVSAQCTMQNKAIGANEKFSYKLYFNWKFIWVTAGTAEMITQKTTYQGKPAFSSSLITKSSSRIDKYFRMRDTLKVYASNELAPLYYKKASHEGKRNYADEMWYSYPNGKCAVTHKIVHNDGSQEVQKHVYNDCVYDMLNIFLRARNFDATNWKKGHVESMNIAGFSNLVKARLVYMGKKDIKAENDKKYKCLELKYEELEDGKWHEVVRFFVTDDSRHVPIRLDLSLKFGSAKAFLQSGID